MAAVDGTIDAEPLAPDAGCRAMGTGFAQQVFDIGRIHLGHVSHDLRLESVSMNACGREHHEFTCVQLTRRRSMRLHAEFG
jgi:hypothetical protein